MIYAAPGSAFEASTDGFATGLTGTLTWRLVGL